MTLRVVLVDDHTVLCEALGQCLEAEPDMELAAVASTSIEARRFFESSTADVAVVDVALGVDDGIELARWLRGLPDPPTVVVLTCLRSREVVLSALAAGASGFVSKNSDPDEVARCIRLSAAGHICIWPEPIVGAWGIGSEPSFSDPATLVASLSPRERETLSLMVSGMGRAAIASELYVSLNTVRTHMTHIFRKLGVRSRTEAVSLALRAGLRPVPSLEAELASTDHSVHGALALAPTGTGNYGTGRTPSRTAATGTWSSPRRG